MKILLDTHIALWSVLHSQALSSKAKDLLLSSENEIYYSVISLWEVSLKHSISPSNMEITASEFRELCQQSGFHEISIESMHVLGLDHLSMKEGAAPHKDPFDRLLLSQAITDNLSFMTHDSKILSFKANNLIDV